MRFLLLIARWLGRQADSEIARTVSMDHRNDAGTPNYCLVQHTAHAASAKILGNGLVLLIVAGSAHCRSTGQGGDWLDKVHGHCLSLIYARSRLAAPFLCEVDPASSMLLAVYVLVCWMSTANEQLRVLSDKRGLAAKT